MLSKGHKRKRSGSVTMYTIKTGRFAKSEGTDETGGRISQANLVLF
ncbi:hypothetical protein [Metallosphaera sp.]